VVKDKSEDMGFSRAARRFEEITKPPPAGRPRQHGGAAGIHQRPYSSVNRHYKTKAWETLVLYAAQRPAEYDLVFYHCHRFQAEYKMCQNLIVTALVLGFALICVNGWPWIYLILTIPVVAFLLWAAGVRDERRWFQMLSFGGLAGFLPPTDNYPKETVAVSSILRIALKLVGVIFLAGIYPLMIIWPSGWAWHTGHSDYPLMIVGIYATLGVFLIIVARDPLRHLSLI
jgi:hypothetical protein